MRVLLTSLLFFCVFVGLNARVFAGNCISTSECGHVVESCCGDHQVSKAPEENRHDEDSCPMEHHRHTCCSHGLPVGIDFQVPTKVAVPGSVLLAFLHEGDLPPEEPFLGSEKPPLI